MDTIWIWAGITICWLGVALQCLLILFVRRQKKEAFTLLQQAQKLLDEMAASRSFPPDV